MKKQLTIFSTLQKGTTIPTFPLTYRSFTKINNKSNGKFMNKSLLLSSLFLFNACAAQEESVISNSESSQATTSESPAIVYDLLLELDSINDNWSCVFNQTKELINRAQNSETNDNISDALKLSQAIYQNVLNPENSAMHGSLCSSLYENDSMQARTFLEKSSAPQSIAIRFIITRNNDSNPTLWTTLESMVNFIQESLEATQQSQDVEEKEEEITTENNQTDSEKIETAMNPIAMISETVNQLLALVQDDNNASVSQCVYIHAQTTDNETE